MHGVRRRAGSARQRCERARPSRRRCGASGRPCRYSNVVSSGAIMPARAPASIDMLQTVMRSSIDSAAIARPRYSMHVAGAAARCRSVPMMREDQVLRGDAAAERAVDVDRERLRPALQQALRREHVRRPRSCRCRRRARRTRRACWCGCRRRRSSCPAASAPSSGPMTCTMPRPRAAQRRRSLTPNSSQLRSSCRDLLAAAYPRSRTAAEHSGVRTARGTSSGPCVASVMRRAAAPEPARAQQTSKACGRRDLVDQVQVDIEDGRRVRPSPARRRASQTFSNRLCAVIPAHRSIRRSRRLRRWAAPSRPGQPRRREDSIAIDRLSRNARTPDCLGDVGRDAGAGARLRPSPFVRAGDDELGRVASSAGHAPRAAGAGASFANTPVACSIDLAARHRAQRPVRHGDSCHDAPVDVPSRCTSATGGEARRPAARRACFSRCQPASPRAARSPRGERAGNALR